MQNQGRYLILIAILYILEDLLLLNLLFFVLLGIFDLRIDGTYHLVVILINLGYLLSFAVVRVNFNDVKQLHIPHLVRRNFLKLAITAFVLLLCLFLLKDSSIVSRMFIFTFFSSAYVLMIIAHWITRKAVTFAIRNTISKGIILGAGPIGERLFEELLRNIYNGVVIMGFFDDNSELDDLSGNIEEAKEFALTNGITHVFCTLPLSAEEKIQDFIKFCESNVITFHVIPAIGYYYTGGRPPVVEQIGKMPVFVLRNIPLSYIHTAVMKRGVDILISSVVILLLFPVLFPLLAILIKMSSPGPVFFKQKRTGERGKEFYCYKFRTMRVSAEAHSKQATKDDNRKTKLGTFLRKSSLDELPQLINVFIGNMSLVGPRPHMLLHTHEYSPKVDKYMVRHFVKPGITGLAQVRGFRGETKEIELMEKRIMADVEYVENWTLQLDFKIMVQTALALVKGDEKAY
jgi:putative colanic acid biosynthesis UDP-glucose lipid carrier transferase